MRILVWVCAFMTPIIGWSQQKEEILLTKEVRLVVDNDVFLSLINDQYYSSGIFGYYRWLKKNSDSNKSIRSVSINQRMYTPRKVRWDEINEFDRPYAGLLSMFLTQENYIRKNQYVLSRLELGWMGPANKTGEIHEYWHGVLGLPNPNGWDYQIQNSPIINGYFTYARTLASDLGIDLISETNVSMGTIFNNIRQELMVRIGSIRNIGSGVHYNGNLGTKYKLPEKGKLVEGYMFYSPGIEYNFYNATIEGNIVGPLAPHTETPKNWIWQNRIGLMLSWISFDVQMIVYTRSQETTEANKHYYMSIQLNKRF